MLTYDDLVTFWEEITNTHYNMYGGWHGEVDIGIYRQAR